MAYRTQMGNAFAGFITEFPGVRVDCFDNDVCRKTGLCHKDVEFHLLTHAHTDHLRFLDSKEFCGKLVYCSEVTRRVLAEDRKDYNTAHLRSLESNTTHTLDYRGSTLKVTLIPANHCPGSVMFLLEGNSRTVLITGDIRAEDWWTQSIPRNPLLFPFTTNWKQIDMIYLDTTYQYRQLPYLKMLQNYEGLQLFFNFLNCYVPAFQFIDFYYADSTLGFEEAWGQISNLFNTEIHTTKDMWRRTNAVVNTGGYEYGDKIIEKMKTAEGPKFHVCGPMHKAKCLDEKKFNVRLKAAIDIPLEELFELSLPVDMGPHRLVPSWLDFLFDLEDGYKVYGVKGDHETRYLMQPESDDYRSNLLLRNQMFFYFSRHSSYEECYNFVKMFNAKDVYPIVEDEESWTKRGFSIETHFGDALSGDSFRYDNECRAEYGTPVMTLKEKPETTDKQWTREKNFLVSLREQSAALTTNRFKIRGQARLPGAFDEVPDESSKAARDRYIALYHEGKVFQGRNQQMVAGKLQKGDVAGAFKRDKVHRDDHDEAFNDSQDDNDEDQAFEMLMIQKNNQKRKEYAKKKKRTTGFASTQPVAVGVVTALMVEETKSAPVSFSVKQEVTEVEILTPIDAVSFKSDATEVDVPEPANTGTDSRQEKVTDTDADGQPDRYVCLKPEPQTQTELQPQPLLKVVPSTPTRLTNLSFQNPNLIQPMDPELRKRIEEMETRWRKDGGTWYCHHELEILQHTTNKQ